MARRGVLDWWRGQPVSGPKSLPPFREAGVSGTPIYGGFVLNREINAKLVGQQRYRTASDILCNISVVAAGVRYFLNLCGKPKWKAEPVDDTPAARDAADFVEAVIAEMSTSWARIVRRSGMYRYHGFGIGEWTAKRRDDGRIGLVDIEQRPQHTIWRWGTDPNGQVSGVWQRDPMNGNEIWLPRSKLVYLVDDMMTDDPEGLGWFRALADPAERMKRFQELETIAFERNLAGTPIGRVPYSEIEAAVAAGTVTRADANAMIKAMEEFVDLQVKEPTTSLILDSAPYESITADGTNVSSVYKWSIELMTGDMTGIEQLNGKDGALQRLTYEMARIIGVESILTGAQGAGSMALAAEQSNNLYTVVNSTVADMAEGFNRDIIAPIWKLNGFPDELRPTLKCEDVAFKDVEQIAAMLRDMAAAGAVLTPDDPAINDMRDLAGISRVPDDMAQRQIDEAAELRAATQPIDDDGNPIEDQEDEQA